MFWRADPREFLRLGSPDQSKCIEPEDAGDLVGVQSGGLEFVAAGRHADLLVVVVVTAEQQSLRPVTGHEVIQVARTGQHHREIEVHVRNATRILDDPLAAIGRAPTSRGRPGFPSNRGDFRCGDHGQHGLALLRPIVVRIDATRQPAAWADVVVNVDDKGQRTAAFRSEH
jgi:hypothetical protein